MLTDLMKKAVSRGWTPRDLIHVLGPEIQLLLPYWASSLSTHASTPAIRASWVELDQIRDESHEVVGLGRAEYQHLARGLAALPRLPDELYDEKELRESLNFHEIQRIHQLLPTADEPGFLLYYQHILREEDRTHELLVEEFEQALPAVICGRVYLGSDAEPELKSALSTIAHHCDCACLAVADQRIALVMGTQTDVHHVLSLFHAVCGWVLSGHLDADDLELVLADATHFFYTLRSTHSPRGYHGVDFLRARLFRACDLLCVFYPQLARSGLPPYA